MTGRVIIVTGGNSGIGFEVAKYLAEGGNDVVLACKSLEKGEESVARIKQLYPNALIQCMEVDLSSLASIRTFVAEFTQKKRKLSVLINNAALALNPKDLTPRATSDGLELTMATNHFGPFLLTNLLRDYLVQTAKFRDLDFLDVKNLQLQSPGSYNGLQAYKNSKLCNVLMTYYMATTLRGQNVTVNAVNPGFVPQTRLSRHRNRIQRYFDICCLHYALRCAHITRTVRQAALQIVNLAISEKYEGETGKFYCDGIEERSSVESYDTDLQKAVWSTSCRLVNHRIGNVEEDIDDDVSLG